MATSAQDTSGYYVWEAEGKAFKVHVLLDAMDAVLAEIMRGFGAVPKRGAEVGGLLIGSVELDGATVVRIENFEPLDCAYTRGPSFLLSAEERKTFADACARWGPDPSRRTYAVGYFRSHTRDGLSLGSEDIELMDGFFPDAASVALLVKPFATKASLAGFFFRENGAFQESTPLEFPFRRRELTGEDAPQSRPLTGRRPRESGAEALAGPVPREPAEGAQTESPQHAYAETAPARSRLGAWMWFPLSFVFLLLGVALGYLAALNVGPRAVGNRPADYALSLAVQKSGENLLLRWNTASALIGKADRGVLEIRDGGYATTVNLDATSLHDGKIIFGNKTDAVTFDLTVFLNSNLSVTEKLAWHQ
jgi:hypothetical protein